MSTVTNERRTPKWAWRGAHRGAGITTLAREFGGADLGMTSTPSLPILVVCRCSISGLIAAQHLAASELSESPTWKCLGLVIVADGPGRLHKPVSELAALVAGGYPAQWSIPWVESWRVQPMMTMSATALSNITQTNSRLILGHRAPRRMANLLSRPFIQ